MNARDQLTLVAAVASATSEEELIERLNAAAIACGFEYFLFGFEMRRPANGRVIQHVASAYPEQYQALYRQRNFAEIDPTISYCKTYRQPLVWNEDMYTSASYEVMEESRGYGLGHGVSVPVHESANVVSMLSLARDKPFESAAEKELVIAAGTVLANAVHVVAKREVLPRLEQQQQPKLTPRERECLKWLTEGKSNGVIGDILNISEAAVVWHIGNLYAKLKVSTRLQAAVVALQMGLLD